MRGQNAQPPHTLAKISSDQTETSRRPQKPSHPDAAPETQKDEANRTVQRANEHRARWPKAQKSAHNCKLPAVRRSPPQRTPANTRLSETPAPAPRAEY